MRLKSLHTFSLGISLELNHPRGSPQASLLGKFALYDKARIFSGRNDLVSALNFRLRACTFLQLRHVVLDWYPALVQIWIWCCSQGCLVDTDCEQTHPRRLILRMRAGHGGDEQRHSPCEELRLVEIPACGVGQSSAGAPWRVGSAGVPSPLAQQHPRDLGARGNTRPFKFVYAFS